MWNKNCGGYGVMKKKKLSPYEKLKKALLIDHVLGLSFIVNGPENCRIFSAANEWH